MMTVSKEQLDYLTQVVRDSRATHGSMALGILEALIRDYARLCALESPKTYGDTTGTYSGESIDKLYGPGVDPTTVRTPDGDINNCALANGDKESNCQICNGMCPDRARFSASD